MPKNALSPKDKDALLRTLEARFAKHPERHKGVKWETVAAKLEKNAAALWSVKQMEDTGGEPDVVTLKKGSIAFVDCSPQSPKRRSVCYDRTARVTRKEHPPKSSAEETAKDMGIEMLDEDRYRALQEVGEFDTTTSSWIVTPEPIRKKGGALFCDRRYGHVFTYHNSADSYYAARGFRGMVTL